MAKFTTRVELHEADSSDYDELHEHMKAEGFRTTISGSDNTYVLPTAEYNYQGEVEIDDVLAWAKSAANKTGRKYSILVTEAVQRKWVGLKLA